MLKLDEFDIEDMNYRIKKVPLIYREIYEQNLELSLNGYNVLSRKYILLRKTPKVFEVKVKKKRKKRKKKK